MSKTVWSLVLCTLWLAGCDPSIGTEECIGSACSKPMGLQPTLLNVSFQEVSTQDPADLPIKWRIPRPCTGMCTPAPPISLYRAAGDAVWTEPRDGTLLTVDRVDVTGAVSRTAIVKPPLAISGLLGSYVSADLQGRAVVHLQWDPTHEPVDQVALLQPSSLIGLVGLMSPAKLLPPLALITSPAGYLLFKGDENGQIVRLVDHSGATTWQQTRFPQFANHLGTSAVFFNDRFVLSASDGDPKDVHYGLLALDSQGVPVEFDVNSDSRWTSATIVQLGSSAYAVAAGSDLYRESFVGSGEGNVDVIAFGVGPGPIGYRMKRSCLLNLSVFGFTADAAGNLYVSSLAGTESVPRGLLCQLSSTRSRCFQTEPNLLLGQIAATDAGVIFAAAGDEILRIELPP